MIFNDIKNIENQLKKDLLLSNYIYYEFIKIYSFEIQIISEKLSISKKIKKNISIFFLLNEFNIDYSSNSYIFSNECYFRVLISIFIIKSFHNDKILEIKNNFMKDFENFYMESDKIINYILNDIKNFIIWLEIIYNENTVEKKYIKFESREIRLTILECINLLTSDNIITQNNRWLGNKEIKFYDINIEYKNFIYTSLYKEKFKIIEIREKNYIYINHYTNIFEIFKENIYSSKNIKMEINTKFFENILNIKAKIDYELLEYHFNNLLKKLKIKKEKINEYYMIMLKEYKKLIKLKDNNSISECSKKISQLLNLIRLNEILKEKNEDFFYFPPIICFRGRTYFNSSISFTFYREFRYCLYLGYYDNDYKEPYHPLNKKWEKLLENYTKKINKINKFDLNNKNLDEKIAIIWVLISIAEIDKKKLGDKIKIEDFIEHGINILNENIELENLDEFDNLKIKSLIKILEEINEGGERKIRLVSKDATASCFQHLIKILGPREEESWKWCNLSSEDTWYDTYSYILKKWKDNTEKDKDWNKIENFFTRKTIKKVTMTYQYGASKKTCEMYFLKEIGEIDKETKEIVKKYFKDYYNFISNDSGILNKKSSIIIDKLKEINYEITTLDDAKIDLKYNKTTKKQIKITINKKRYTKQELILENEIDIRKIKTSSRANYIHALDSAVVRDVISIKPILCIHDCFLIDYMSINFLISIVNDAMNKEFHDLKIYEKTKTYSSPFIII